MPEARQTGKQLKDVGRDELSTEATLNSSFLDGSPLLLLVVEPPCPRHEAGAGAWGHDEEGATPGGPTALQPPLPSSRAVGRGLGRDGSGNHRWGDREGWGAEWWLGRCASEMRFPVEKVGYRQAMPSRGHGAFTWTPGTSLPATSVPCSPESRQELRTLVGQFCPVPSSSFGRSPVSGGGR